jgi:hypothetical protein
MEWEYSVASQDTVFKSRSCTLRPQAFNGRAAVGVQCSRDVVSTAHVHEATHQNDRCANLGHCNAFVTLASLSFAH